MNDATIQMIAQAIIANTQVLDKLVSALSTEDQNRVAAVAVPAVTPSPVTATPAPVAAPTPAPVVAPAPVAPAAPAMPPLPSFAAPAPVAAAPTVPFTDGKGLITYVMGVYQAIGPVKGAGIQNVLTSLGYTNINDVKPEHYPTLFAQIEALKA